MKRQHLSLVGIVIASLIASIFVVSAQEDAATKRLGIMGARFATENILQDASGLEPDAMLEALKSGSTLAELIGDNGGDVDAVIASLVVIMSEQINERMETLLDGLETEISELVNGTWHRGVFGKGFFDAKMILNESALLEAVNLDQAGLRQAMRDGSTLAELIAANGVEADQVVSGLVQTTSERIAQRMRVLLDSLEERVSERVNGPWNEVARHKKRWETRRLLDSAVLLEVTGLDEAALREAQADGATLAELIEANDGDVNTTISSLVDAASAAINERTQATLNGLESRITQQVNDEWDIMKSRKGRRGRGYPRP